MEKIVKELPPQQEPVQRPPVKFKIDDSPDYQYLVQKWAIRGWQNGCIAGIPILLILGGRRGNSMNLTGLLAKLRIGKVQPKTKTLFERTLGASWQGGVVGGVTGAGLGLVRYQGMDKHELRRRRIEYQFAEKNLRRDGLSTIGGALMAVLTPALFWNQTTLINLVLGGWGLGTIAGVASALVMDAQEPPGTSDSTDTFEKEAAIKAGVVKPGE